MTATTLTAFTAAEIAQARATGLTWRPVADGRVLLLRAMTFSSSDPETKFDAAGQPTRVRVHDSSLLALVRDEDGVFWTDEACVVGNELSLPDPDRLDATSIDDAAREAYQIFSDESQAAVS